MGRLGTSLQVLFQRFDFKRFIFGIVVFLVFFYIVFFSAYSILLHEVFYTQAFDAGIEDQGAWLLSRFMEPLVTVRGLNIFGDSVTLYHFIAAFFLWFWDSINILFILQSVCIAAGAIPLFLYARERLKNDFLAVCVSFSFLLYPALQNLNLDQYHPESFAVFFMIMTIFFMLRKRYSLFYLFLALSLIAKDEVALTGVFIGLYLIIFQKQFRHGSVSLGMSLFWYLVCSRILMPWFNGIGILAPQPLTYSHWFQGLMSNPFNLNYYFTHFFHPESLRYYFHLLAPVVFLPFLSLKTIFLLLPSVGVNVLSGCGYLRSIDYHYNYIQSALIFFAMIEGLYALINHRLIKGISLKYSGLILGSVIIVTALYSNILLSHLPLNRAWFLFQEKMDLLNSDEVKLKKEALNLIPKNAKVAASYSLVPHLSHRQEIYMFPNPFRSTLWNHWFQEGRGIPPAEGHVDYVVIDWGNHGDEEQLIIRYLLSSAAYQEIYRKNPIVILKKREAIERKKHSGANFILYELDRKISIHNNFSKELKVRKRGKFSMLYFPDSNYYFRNLLGEEVPAEKEMALEIFGYLFIPVSGQYHFDIQSDAAYLMRVDGKNIGHVLNLERGYHKYQIKYLNYGRRFNLKLTVKPSWEKSYIISEHLLKLKDLLF